MLLLLTYSAKIVIINTGYEPERGMFLAKMSEEEALKMADNKLMILYLLDKMDLPMTNAQITDFFVAENLLTYFELQQLLAKMVADTYLDKHVENNTARYTLTDLGVQTLEYLGKRVVHPARSKINAFVNDNRKIIKKSYEITANYFYDHQTGEFIVKCGTYDGDITLMEIALSVVTREQAKHICRVWKANVNQLYGKFLDLLTEEPVRSEEAIDEPAKDEATIVE